MAAEEGQEGISYDERSGVFGHKVAMLDFSPAELERFRQIGRIVEFQDEAGVVETALAISGSSAQSKVQTYPGDMDFFERVNILAPDREEACRILARIMREKALERAARTHLPAHPGALRQLPDHGDARGQDLQGGHLGDLDGRRGASWEVQAALLDGTRGQRGVGWT